MIARKMGMSNSTAFLSGCMVVFDCLNAIESRLILVDSQLMFYCGLALYTALRFWERRNEVRQRPKQPAPVSGPRVTPVVVIACESSSWATKRWNGTREDVS